MGSRVVLGAVLACACGNAHLGTTMDAPKTSPDGPRPIDSPNQIIDAPVDALMWSVPQGVPGADTPTLAIDDETLSSTQLEMYFGIVDTALTGSPKQLWMMSRATTADPWSAPTKLGAEFNVPPGTANAPTEESPRLAHNDLTIYFGRAGNIYCANRTAVGAAWGTPTAVTQVNTGPYVKWLAVCANDYFMISRADAPNGQDLYEGQLGGANGPGTLVTELNSANNETSTFLSEDCLTTYFASNRSGTTQIYTATRTSTSTPWTTPTLVTTYGASSDNEDPWLSSDGHTFYLASTRYPAPNQANKGVYVSTY